MNTQTLKVGDRVLFGRSHGEQTMGTVLRVNAKSVQVRQDEARGTMRSHAIGTKWKVAPNLVRKAEADYVAPEAPKPRRSEQEILRDIINVYGSLSPENLTCDGEISYAEATRKARALNARLRDLQHELGRPVSEADAYRLNGY
jgi:hypothetical protein